MAVHLSGVTVGLEQTSYTVEEGSGTLSVCAVLSGMAQRNVTVTLSTVQGIAQGKYTFFFQNRGTCVNSCIAFRLTADSDFTSTTIELEFQPASTRACGNISILEDSRLENSETFSVELNTTDQAVVLNPMMAIVSIADNDSK